MAQPAGKPATTSKPALTGIAKARSVGGKAYGKGGKKGKKFEKMKKKVFGIKKYGK